MDPDEPPDHGLEFLLAFDGRVHHLEGGYWIKFEIRKVATSRRRPHGLSYWPDGARLIGFDNAHRVSSRSQSGQRVETSDHWHRTGEDPGRPYAFKDAAKLVNDFFDEVERVLAEHGVGTAVVRVDEPGSSK